MSIQVLIMRERFKRGEVLHDFLFVNHDPHESAEWTTRDRATRFDVIAAKDLIKICAVTGADKWTYQMIDVNDRTYANRQE